MIEMTIDSIRVSLMNYQRVVILREREKCPDCGSMDMEKLSGKKGSAEWKCGTCGKITTSTDLAIRYLPIWIGPAEADAIAVKLQGVTVPRPMTHDLLHSVIEKLDAKVKSILVNDLKNDTFYAKIFLDVDGQQVEVDSRPSDAMALIVRQKGIPIFVEDKVLNAASILLDAEGDTTILNERDEEISKFKPVNDEEMKKKMPGFYDFINTLDLDDFDKHKS